jgi:hypothetical protein
MADIVERLKWWGAKRRPPRNMPTLPADCAEGSKAIAALRTELAVKETEALGYLRAVGQLQDRVAETRAAALEDAAKVADTFTCGLCGMDGKAGAAIRALIAPVDKDRGNRG